MLQKNFYAFGLTTFAVSILHPGIWVRGAVISFRTLQSEVISPHPPPNTAIHYSGTIKVVPALISHMTYRHMGVRSYTCILLILNFAVRYRKFFNFTFWSLYTQGKSVGCPFNSRLMIRRGSLNALALILPTPDPWSSSYPPLTLTPFPTINLISRGQAYVNKSQTVPKYYTVHAAMF
jgi:hypothetical protein